MIELPEGTVLSQQINEKLIDRKISAVFTPTSKHRFAFFNGDPQQYEKMLTGKTITKGENYGMFVDMHLDDNTTISIGDGVNMRYGDNLAKAPSKYQLLLTLDDNSFIVYTVGLYGMIYPYKERFENKYYNLSRNSISPLTKEFDEAYYENFLARESKNISAKALLATEQRIPGVGNGVIQDILFNASINPKRKIFTFTDDDKINLFKSLKSTLADMTAKGGRNTETDLFGNKGGYKSILSKNTNKEPCPKCGDTIRKEAFLGGAIYYCPTCQKL